MFHRKRILFLRQINDFAIAAPDAKTSDMLMDLINEKLSEPIKRQGYLDLYNGVDILQTRRQNFCRESVRHTHRDMDEDIIPHATSFDTPSP